MIQYLQILLNTRRDDERGASAVEYGLLVALIAFVIIGAVTLIGGNLTTLFTNVAGSL
jgi:pilus assembly protein Flp/PilA